LYIIGFGQLLTLCQQLPNFRLQGLSVSFQLCQRINIVSGQELHLSDALV